MQNTQHSLLLLSEVADLCRVPVGTVRHWIRTGRLASLRPGRKRLIRREDLSRFLANAEDGTEGHHE
jgi:excisionase family DNA binding protein